MLRDEKRERDFGFLGLFFMLNILFLIGGCVFKDSVMIDERLF